MTNDQITSLAKQVYGTDKWNDAQLERLQRFTELVRNHALNEAAQKCTEIALAPSNVILGVAVTCAEQIRSLKK